MDLGQIIAQEEAERQRLALAERLAARGDLSQTAIAAAQRAVAAVAARDGGSLLGEPGRDLRRLRTDPALMRALTDDLAAARQRVSAALMDAMLAGFAIAGRLRTDGLPLTVTVTDQDRIDLQDYPIQGFTVYEWTADLSRSLLDDVNKALAMPLSTTIDAATIPAELGRAVDLYGGRTASVLEQAHLAGVAAAVRAIGAALTGR